MATPSTLKSLCRPHEGEVYRAHHPMWAYKPLSGGGGAHFGGRFNPPGMRAVYTSLSQMTALAEAQQGFPYKPVVTLVPYECSFREVLDLTDPVVRDEAGVGWHEIDCNWKLEAITTSAVDSWELATRLQAAGIGAIQVPSFAHGGRGMPNLVIWSWNDAAERTIRVVGDDNRLPRNQASWPS